tara:strand:+ start:290 stop:433 length:144 start_codon:yes stop_codon:yes gene_type:complete
MTKYTFTVYSPLLKKTFINHDYFANEESFRLYAVSLYNNNWSLISIG